MKKGDLVQHIYDDKIIVYELLEGDADHPDGIYALVHARIVYAPHLMSPLRGSIDLDITCLYPANEMLVLALAASK